MMRRLQILTILPLALVILISSCQSEYIESDEIRSVAIEDSLAYSFFVAGHTYGNPMSYSEGLYDGLTFHTQHLNDYPKMEAGFFTGDIVPRSESNYWDAVESDFEDFEMPLFICPGNHDKGDEFDKRYPHFFSMGLRNDLFIVLDFVNNRIDDEQLSFLKETIEDMSEHVNNVFIFCHEVVWYEADGDFSHIEPNSLASYQGTDYWEKIHPLIIDLDQEVYIFSGDVGALTSVTLFDESEKDNVRFYAGGMGNGTIDNIFIVEVNYRGDAKIKLIRLNADYLEEVEF